MSRIDNPGAFGRVGEDPVITGVAWAQTKGIDKSRYASITVSGKPRSCPRRSMRTPGGCSTAGTVSAGSPRGGGTRDGQDRIHPDRGPGAAPIPDGASGWHSVQFTVLPNQKP